MKYEKKQPHKKRQKKGPGPAPDLIWGIHPVVELLLNSPDRILELTLLKHKSTKIQEIIELAKEKGVTLRFAEAPSEGVPEHGHQGVLARIKPVETISLAKLIRITKEKTDPPIILALDNIQDPHNLGAMIRSASAAGVAGIIFTKDRSAPLSGTVAKVSVGAISHLPLCPVTNLVTALKKLQEEGFWTYGAAGDAEQTIYQADISGPVCLVIGGEKSGIRPLVKKQCDFLVSIPMHSSLDSLNASVAAAVIMFEIVRRREP